MPYKTKICGDGTIEGHPIGIVDDFGKRNCAICGKYDMIMNIRVGRLCRDGDGCMIYWDYLCDNCRSRINKFAEGLIREHAKQKEK